MRRGLGRSHAVLVVDDHPLFREMLCSVILQASGSLDVRSVIEAASGEEGVSLASRYGPDVVVMDVGLPGINGFEAARQIREQLPSIAIVMVTAVEEPKWREEAINVGAAGFFMKDKTMADLLPLLSRILQGRLEGD